MTDKKTANFLVTARFPDDTGFAADVDTESAIRQEIANVMQKFIKQGMVSHFAIADDDIISKKLTCT